MPCQRNKTNRGLPARWRLYHGAYYYRVPLGLESEWDGKRQFRLGKTLGEAAQAWAARMSSSARAARSVYQLLDRYAIEVIPTKSVATQQGDKLALINLRRVFGEMRLVDVEPQHIYRYADTRISKKSGKRSPATARYEIGVLRHAFSKAVEWGLLSHHPFLGQVRLKGVRPRRRYVEDWEIDEALSLPSTRSCGSVRMIQAYIRIKRLIGLRRGDMLRLRMSDITDEGIRVTPRKTATTTGITRTFTWTAELRDAIEMAKAARPVHIAPWLFCTRRGAGYFDETTGRPAGWNSIWQRFMKRLMNETKVTQRFTEHDIRAKVANDADSLDRAQQLLGHADSRITARVYRGRKPERIRPLR